MGGKEGDLASAVCFICLLSFVDDFSISSYFLYCIFVIYSIFSLVNMIFLGSRIILICNMIFLGSRIFSGRGVVIGIFSVMLVLYILMGIWLLIVVIMGIWLMGVVFGNSYRMGVLVSVMLMGCVDYICGGCFCYVACGLCYILYVMGLLAGGCVGLYIYFFGDIFIVSLLGVYVGYICWFLLFCSYIGYWLL